MRRFSLEQFLLPHVDLSIIVLFRQGEKTKMFMLKREWVEFRPKET